MGKIVSAVQRIITFWKGRPWQVMIVSGYGRTLRINNLERYLVGLSAAAVVLILAAICLAVLFFNERTARLDAQSSFLENENKFSLLVQENDALLARLAVLNATARTIEGAAVEGSPDERIVEQTSEAIENRGQEEAAVAAEGASREAVISDNNDAE